MESSGGVAPALPLHDIVLFPGAKASLFVVRASAPRSARVRRGGHFCC